jgi:hypothetical protein
LGMILLIEVLQIRVSWSKPHFVAVLTIKITLFAYFFRETGFAIHVLDRELVNRLRVLLNVFWCSWKLHCRYSDLQNSRKWNNCLVTAYYRLKA